MTGITGSRSFGRFLASKTAPASMAVTFRSGKGEAHTGPRRRNRIESAAPTSSATAPSPKRDIPGRSPPTGADATQCRWQVTYRPLTSSPLAFNSFYHKRIPASAKHGPTQRRPAALQTPAHVVQMEHPPRAFLRTRPRQFAYHGEIVKVERAPVRYGMTFLEVMLVVAVIGVVAVVATPRVAGWHDGFSTRRAVDDVASFYVRSRLTAVFRGERVRLEFRADTLKAALETRADSVFLRLPGPAARGVSLSASQPVIRLGPTGLGWGAANTKLVLRRGAAAESLTTSRLGRLKRW